MPLRNRLRFATSLSPWLFAGLVVAGCSSTPSLRPAPGPSEPAVAAPAPVPPPPAPRDVLNGERQRLGELFKGTPVVFVTTSEGNLRATVPRRYCFETASSQVKPPLAAVLDRLARSQRDAASRFRVVAPADPKGRNPALAQQRAEAVRGYLIARGIRADRLQASGTTATEPLELIVQPDAPG